MPPKVCLECHAAITYDPPPFYGTRLIRYLMLSRHQFLLALGVSCLAAGGCAGYHPRVWQPGTIQQQRLRATAIALYLDPRSEYLKSVPAGLRKRAQEWFAANNPFKVRDLGNERQTFRGTGNKLLQRAGRGS